MLHDVLPGSHRLRTSGLDGRLVIIVGARRRTAGSGFRLENRVGVHVVLNLRAVTIVAYNS